MASCLNNKHFDSEYTNQEKSRHILKAIPNFQQARVATRVFEKARETKIIAIQRLVRKFLQRPIILKFGHEKHLLNNLNARFAVQIFK